MKNVNARRAALAVVCLALVGGCVVPEEAYLEERDEGDAGASFAALSPFDWTQLAPGAEVLTGSHHNGTVATIGSRTIMVYVGGRDADGNYIYWSELQPNGTWGWPMRIRDQLSSDRPSLAVFNGRLYMAHVGSSDGSTDVWITRFDTSKNLWSDDYKIPYASNKPPALAALGDRLYIVGGRPSDRKLWMASFDRNDRLSPITYLDHQYSGSRVSLTNYRGRIAMAHRSQAGVVYNEFDGTRWLGETLVRAGVGGTPIHAYEPSIAVSGNEVHMAYHPQGSYQVWYTTFDGTSWDVAVSLNGYSSHTAPVLSRVAGRILLVTNADCEDWNYCRPIDWFRTYQYLDR
jgi:hypothetical protein